VIDKGTDLMTLTKVLHDPSFFINFLSISVIIREQKYIVTFDIPKMIFHEKETCRILETEHGMMGRDT
jgi:hypothetical protein